MTAADALRARLARGGILMAPGAPDAFAARLIAQAGFEALYMTGLGATASRLGRPDIGLLTQTEMATQARDMVRAVGIPVIADADTGYGGPANIARTVEEYAQAGVAAIHLEDQVAPKRCGQLAGIRLIPIEEHVRRLRCAVAARAPGGPLVIGRTDAMPAAGPEEAVRRALMIRDAGVDLVFVDGLKKVAEVEAVARQVPGPKVVSIVDGNETVALDARTLDQMGFAVALYPVTALFAAAKAMADALAVMMRDGTPAAAAPALMSYGAFSAAVDLPRFQALDEAYG